MAAGTIKNVFACVHTKTNAHVYMYLAVLVCIGQEVKAVNSDGQKLRVVLHQQSHQLLQTTSQSDVHLGWVIVQQHVVQSSDGVEQHCIHLAGAGGRDVQRTMYTEFIILILNTWGGGGMRRVYMCFFLSSFSHLSLKHVQHVKIRVHVSIPVK